MKTRNAFIALLALLLIACGGSGGGAGAPQLDNPPSISAIDDRTIIANQAVEPIGFTVTDDRTATKALDLAVMVLRGDVVSADGVRLAGDDDKRSLLVTPREDEVGTAEISIIVTDAAGLSDAANFRFTVAPQRQPIAGFTRVQFAATADGDPALVNAIEFEQDADDDGFEDLLSQ